MYLPQKVLAIIQAIGDLSFGGSTLRAPPLNSAPGATATVQGFDISHWQATVDFQVAYDSGARFVIIKVGAKWSPSRCSNSKSLTSI